MTNVILVFKTTCITTDTVNDTLLNLSPGLKKVKNFNPPHITYTHHNAYDFFLQIAILVKIYLVAISNSKVLILIQKILITNAVNMFALFGMWVIVS
jgi:hypothetical protein